MSTVVRPDEHTAPGAGCEYPDCLRLAEFTVHAQWSWADFVDYESCPQHLVEILDQLGRRRVDGQPVIDLVAEWHELPSLESSRHERGTAKEGGAA